MPVSGGNILADIPRALAKEQFIELLSAPHLRIERIVSIGHSSPPGHFDDQDWAEWVLVLQGSAKVRSKGNPSRDRLVGGTTCIFLRMCGIASSGPTPSSKRFGLQSITKVKAQTLIEREVLAISEQRLIRTTPFSTGSAINDCVDARAGSSDIQREKKGEHCVSFNFSSCGESSMARRKDRDIAWERAATIRGKNPRAWRRDDRGNRIRYGSFKTRGKYAWTLERGKPTSTAQQA